MDAEKIYQLMIKVSGQLETLLAREDFVTKSELAKYTQAIKQQQVPAPDSAKLAQYLLPELVAQLPRQLPMRVQVAPKEVAELLSPVISRQATTIEASNEKLLRGLPQHLAAIEVSLAGWFQTIKTVEVSWRAAAATLPHRVAVDFVRGWRELFIIALGPVVVVMILLLLAGAFSKEPVSTYNEVVTKYKNLATDYNALKAQSNSLQGGQAAQQRELNFYRAEVQRYRQKNPKVRAVLPLYAPASR